MEFPFPSPPYKKILPPATARFASVRKLVDTFLIPQVEWTRSNILQIIDDILRSPLFQIVLGCILFVLAFVKAVSVAVAIAIALAWFVTVYGVVRYRPIKSSPPKARLAITVACAVILFFPAVLYFRWAAKQAIPNEAASKYSGPPRSEEVKLFIQCQRSFLPKLAPPGGTLYLLQPWVLPAENGGGGLSERATTSEFSWPTDKFGQPLSAYRCEMTNYGKEAVTNVSLAPHLIFRKAIAQGNGQLNSGEVTVARDWPFRIRKIDPGKGDSFIFYAVNQTEQFLDITFPTEATVAVMGDVRTQLATLTHSDLDTVRLWPFIFIPSAPESPSKSRATAPHTSR